MTYTTKEQLYKSQIMRWRRRKEEAINYMGGKCCKCGYDKHPAAMHFHHTDPTTKDFTWTKLRLKSWDKVYTELDKCILLCANCHAEEHTTSKYDSN